LPLVALYNYWAFILTFSSHGKGKGI